MFGPRTGHAVSTGFWVAASLFGLAMVADRAGFMSMIGVSPTIGAADIGYLPVLIGMAVWLYLLRWGSKPALWSSLIDQELAAYDPVDTEAYRTLQQRTLDAGYLDVDEIRIWVMVERSALAKASGRYTPPEQSFTSKKV